MRVITKMSNKLLKWGSKRMSMGENPGTTLELRSLRAIENEHDADGELQQVYQSAIQDPGMRVWPCLGIAVVESPFGLVHPDTRRKCQVGT